MYAKWYTIPYIAKLIEVVRKLMRNMRKTLLKAIWWMLNHLTIIMVKGLYNVDNKTKCVNTSEALSYFDKIEKISWN